MFQPNPTIDYGFTHTLYDARFSLTVIGLMTLAWIDKLYFVATS